MRLQDFDYNSPLQAIGFRAAVVSGSVAEKPVSRRAECPSASSSLNRKTWLNLQA